MAYLSSYINNDELPSPVVATESLVVVFALLFLCHWHPCDLEENCHSQGTCMVALYMICQHV